MDDSTLDRDLLFGILTVQDELITPEQLEDVCTHWEADGNVTMADRLRARGWLTEADCAEISRRVDRRVRRHGDDPRATLDAALSIVPLTVVAEGVRNTQLLSTLEHLKNLAASPLARSAALPAGSHARYTLTKLHGEGGLGKVWVARDSDLNRDVALKEIKGARDGDDGTLRRFLREAQITGQLEHPNIVPVYEMGRRPETGQPFYTMRLVRGRTLRAEIKAFHARSHASGGFDPVAFQKLLSMFVSICHALGYAHSRKVIHRDLKPDNVLIGDFGEVIVLDWGLAKYVGEPSEPSEAPSETLTLSDESTADMTVGPVGTPVYMAPEQAEGRLDLVDHLSDIYGLGAILFEILTGRPPIVGDTLSEIYSHLVYRETPHARTVIPTVPASLDAICARAMARARENRYPSADALADDITRWLAGEPVSAYPEPLPARLLRWGRKHRTMVASAAMLLLAAVMGLAVHNVAIRRLRDLAVASADEARTQKGLADEHRERAEQNFGLARDAVDQMLTEVGAVELVDIPQMEPVRARLLEKARNFFNQFLEQKRSDPAVRGDLARSHLRLGEIEALLGLYRESEASYRKAIALQKELGGSPGVAADLARSYHGLAVLLRKSNRFRESEAAFREAIALREPRGTAPDATPEEEQALAQSRYHLGALLARLGGQGQKDEAAYRDAIRVQEKLVAGARDQPEKSRELARYLNNMGMLLRDTSRLVDAERAFREAQSILESNGATSAHATPGDRWQMAQVANNLGVLLRDANNKTAARSACETARHLQLELVNEFPHIPDYRTGLASTLNNLSLLVDAASPDEAEEVLQQAMEILEKLAADFPAVPDYRFRLAGTRLNLGNLLARADASSTKADRVYRDALRDFEQLVDGHPDVPEYRYALGNASFCLGDLLARQGRKREARQRLATAIEHQRAALEANPKNLMYANGICLSYQDTADLLAQEGKHESIAAMADELTSLAPDWHNAYLIAASNLARCVQLVTDDATIEASAKRDLMETYGQKAVAALRHAYDRRLIVDPRLLNHESLAPIRDRESFRRLQREMEAKFQPVRTG